VGLQQTFMPAGYPLTVGPNYQQFAGWQAITNFATTANSGEHVLPQTSVARPHQLAVECAC
jgi:hypothetical protein